MSCIGSASFRPRLRDDETTRRDAEHERYPYEGDGGIVLGPDTVASADGSVLLWRGVVYRRVEPIGEIDPLEIV